MIKAYLVNDNKSLKTSSQSLKIFIKKENMEQYIRNRSDYEITMVDIVDMIDVIDYESEND